MIRLSLFQVANFFLQVAKNLQLTSWTFTHNPYSSTFLFLYPSKAPMTTPSPHNTALCKSADHSSFQLDITSGLLHARKGVKKDKESKGSLSAKGEESPHMPEKLETGAPLHQWLQSCSCFSPILLHPSLVVPLLMQLDKQWPDKPVWNRNPEEIKAYTKWAIANSTSPDYQALNTQTPYRIGNIDEKSIGILVRKPDF